MDNEFILLPERLLPWFREHHRDLPWRQDRQPYHVWLSEIMLQQTRVEAVRGYYARFLEALPTVQALAAASPELCQKLWEGLGYYTRVRNLQKAAREITEQYGGEFPRDYEAVRGLSGIGDYTAGAICSICFEQPTAAVDGNVLRVASRLTAEARPVSDPAYRRELTASLSAVYPAGHCGDFTQALMELGATVCVPNGEPRCGECPLRDLCRAREAGTQMQYPVRAAKKPRRAEEKTVFLLRCGDRIALRKRPRTGLLAGLWEYPNVPGTLTVEAALEQAETWQTHPTAPETAVEKTHIFTHVEWKMRCYTIQCAAMPPEFAWPTLAELTARYALPTAFRMFTPEF